MKKMIISSALIIFICFHSNSYGQPLNGIKTIKPSGGNYSSFTAAIADLNTFGVGVGGVTFQVAANAVFNEANIIITATGTMDNPVSFIKDGSGANPVLKSQGVSGSNLDYFFKISGGDNITFNGIDLTMDPAVTDDNLKIEFGFHITNASTTNGAKFITVKNSVIQLDRTLTNKHSGVYMNHEFAPADINSVCSGLHFENIVVKKGSDGIIIHGRNGSLPSSDITIDKCQIGMDGAPPLITDSNTSFGMGISVRYCRDVVISNNEVLNIITNNTLYGIYTDYLYGNNMIFNNKVHNLFSTQTTPDIDVMGIYHSSSAPTNTDIFNNLIYDLDDSQTSGSAGYYHLTGLYTSGTANTNIIHNILCLSSANPYTLSVPLWITGAFNVKNNIVADFSVPPVNTNRILVLSSGTATLENNLFYIDETHTNNYSFTASQVNYKFKDYQKGTTRPSPGYYLKNIFANPNFASPETLIPLNPSPASDNGLWVSFVYSDINYIARSAENPDVGAFEGQFGVRQDFLPPLIRFQPLPSNADPVVTLTALITDNNLVSSAIFWYRQRGTTNEFTGVTGNKFGDTWTFSFTPPAPAVYEYFVCAKDNSGNVISNGFMTSGLDASKTGLSVNNPAANPDYTYTFGYKRQLSGDLTVGYESSNYTSLTGTGGLFEAINNSVITGDINAIITTDIIEPGSFDLKQWTESGTGNYHLTIKPNNSNLHTLITLSAGKSIILNGADRVTIDGSFNNDNSNHIKFENSGSNILRLISDGSNGCEDITVKFCNMTSGATSALTSTGSNHANWLFDHIYVDKGAAGMNINYVNNATVTNCTFGNTDVSNTITNYGLYLLGSMNVTIEKNIFRNIITLSSTTWPRGIYLSGVTGGTIQKNKITGVKYTGTSPYGAAGLFITRSKSLMVANNIISDIQGAGSNVTVDYMLSGLIILNSSDLNIYYNSINLFGTGNSINSAKCSALLLLSNSGCEFINNIFSNTIQNTNSSTQTSALNMLSDLDRNSRFRNNIYHVGGSGSNQKCIISYRGIPLQDLILWQAADNVLSDGNDLGSGGYVEPGFVSGSTSDLRLTDISPALNSALPVIVTEDFNGTLRHPATPDIGALENPVYPLSLDECAPVISYIPIQNSPSTTFTWPATITDNTYVSGAKFWYRLKGTSGDFNAAEGIKQADGKTWNFTISNPLNSGSEYEYLVCATDPYGNSISNGITSSYINPSTIGLNLNNPPADPYFVRTFKVADNTISIGEVPEQVYVSSVSPTILNVPFTITGTFTSNEFIAWLSDKNGNFTNKTEVGRLTSNNSGIITINILPGTMTGYGYRIYLESTNPSIRSLPGNCFSILLDNTSPSITLSSNNMGTISSAVPVKITFSENISGLTSDDLSIINGTASALTGGDMNYSITLTPLNEGPVSISLPANRISDLAGNMNTASNILEFIYIEKDAPRLNIGPTDGNYSFNSSPKNVTITFDQDISGFEPGDITIQNGSISGFTPEIANPMKVFTCNILPVNEGIVRVTVPSEVVTNGLKGNAISSTNFNFDFTSPDVSLFIEGGQSEVTGTFRVFAFFSENISEMTLADLSVINGSAGNLVSLSQAVYYFDVTPASNGIIKVNIPAGNVNDQAGNTNNASDEISVNYVVTGIEKPAGMKINVFPNPTNDFINISVSGYESIYKIRLLDLQGRLLLDRTGEPLSTISLKGFTPGTYFILIETGSTGRVFPVVLK